MKRLVVALVSASSLLVSVAALAQSTPAPAAAGAPAAAPAQDSTAAAAPVPGAKRAACQSSTQALKGQDKRDQMQLCMAQAHLDCLKQAIDQKITGPQRKDFVKSCAG
jgi:parvulin-like peptidyl-prolyl isomerase